MDTYKLSKIMKALSNPNRLEIFLKIAEKNEEHFETNKECFITDIMKSFNIGAPTISHHLKELTGADLIITERRGKFLIAKVNEKTLKEISAVLKIR